MSGCCQAMTLQERDRAAAAGLHCGVGACARLELALRDESSRHRDWWTMQVAERQRILRYEAGYDDGYGDGWEVGHRTAIDRLLTSLPAAILDVFARRAA